MVDSYWLVLDLLGDSGQLWLAEIHNGKVTSRHWEYTFDVVKSIEGWFVDSTNSLPMSYINQRGSSSWQPLAGEEINSARKRQIKFVENILKDDPNIWKETLVLAIKKASHRERSKNIPLLILAGETLLARELEKVFKEEGWSCIAAVAPSLPGAGGYALWNPDTELHPKQKLTWIDNSLPPSKHCYEWNGSEFIVDIIDWDSKNIHEADYSENTFAQLEQIGRAAYALLWKHRLKEILLPQLHQKQGIFKRNSDLLEKMKKLSEQLRSDFISI